MAQYLSTFIAQKKHQSCQDKSKYIWWSWSERPSISRTKGSSDIPRALLLETWLLAD